MDLPAAVRELRRAAGNNQQAFAGRLGLSPSAIANYEEGREPTSRALYQLGKVAREIGREDLAGQFSAALSAKIGAEISIDIDTSLQARIANELFRNNGDDWLLAQLEDLIASARKGPLVLTSPKTMPNSSMRLAYLESLLVLFRLRLHHPAKDIIDVLTAERARETGETREAAMVEILMQYPELYNRYNQERRDAAAGTQHEPSLATFGTVASPEPTEQPKPTHSRRPGKQVRGLDQRSKH